MTHISKLYSRVVVFIGDWQIARVSVLSLLFTENMRRFRQQSKSHMKTTDQSHRKTAFYCTTAALSRDKLFTINTTAVAAVRHFVRLCLRCRTFPRWSPPAQFPQWHSLSGTWTNIWWDAPSPPPSPTPQSSIASYTTTIIHNWNRFIVTPKMVDLQMARGRFEMLYSSSKLDLQSRLGTYVAFTPVVRRPGATAPPRLPFATPLKSISRPLKWKFENWHYPVLLTLTDSWHAVLAPMHPRGAEFFLEKWH